MPRPGDHDQAGSAAMPTTDRGQGAGRGHGQAPGRHGGPDLPGPTADGHAGTRVTVDRLVAEQARAALSDVAVVMGDQSITYGELDLLADTVARDLREAGVGPEVVVGLYGERSIEAIVGMLAILKAGGAFLPLDSMLPPDRIAVIVADARAALILCDDEHLDTASSLPAPAMALARPRTPSPGTPTPLSGTGNLACVYYTSGSTGTPKGVCLEHRALVNTFEWYRATLPPHRRVLQLASVGFDVSLHEIMSSIACGAELHLYDGRFDGDMDALAAFIERHRITRAVLPPVAIYDLTETYGDRLGTLEEVVSTGERIVVTPAMRRTFTGLKTCVLRNHYGPTESQGDTIYDFSRDPGEWPTAPPAGRPVPGVTVHVVDADLRECPPGAEGELCFGGLGLARGYLGNAVETAARFLPDPFGDAPGARLYRTGDWARVLPSGEVEVFGRVDDQVKIRGYRVEPGEVEATLMQHPDVTEAVVVARDDSTEWGVKRLVGYVRSTGEGDRGIRDFLRTKLPDYMVPGVIVTVDSFPRTVNGKIDRRALPAPIADRPESAGAYEPPRDETERRIAQIWGEILNIRRVGRHDDFFQIGGNSITALQAVARMRATGVLNTSARRLFEWPTIAQLASRKR